MKKAPKSFQEKLEENMPVAEARPQVPDPLAGLDAPKVLTEVEYLRWQLGMQQLRAIGAEQRALRAELGAYLKEIDPSGRVREMQSQIDRLEADMEKSMKETRALIEEFGRRLGISNIWEYEFHPGGIVKRQGQSSPVKE